MRSHCFRGDLGRADEYVDREERGRWSNCNCTRGINCERGWWCQVRRRSNEKVRLIECLLSIFFYLRAE